MSTMLRRVALVAVFGLVASSCSSGETTTSTLPPTTGTPTTVSTTTPLAPSTSPAVTPPPLPTSTTQPTGIMTQADAFKVVFEFDPLLDDPEVLSRALWVTGIHPGLGLPILLESGTPDVQRVVLSALARPSPWSVQTLVAMQELGTPTGTLDRPHQWPDELREAINETLRASAFASYGPLGEMMIDLNRALLYSELSHCAATGCDWGPVWYAVPGAVGSPDGAVTDSMIFEGTVTHVSDTGAGDIYPIVVHRLEGWVPVEGFLADPPAFGFRPFGPIFDGVTVTTSSVTLRGWAEFDTTVSAAGRNASMEFGDWTVAVPLEPGPNEIVLTAQNTSGESSTRSITVYSAPSAETVFGFIRGLVEVDGEMAIDVDLAEFLVGPAADNAARAAGEIGPDENVPNGYFILNRTDELTRFTLGGDPLVRLIDATRGNLTEVSVALDQFLQILDAGSAVGWYGAADEHTPYWLIVEGTDALQIQQQYVP